MQLRLESQNMNDYLQSSDVIDYNSPEIVSLAESLSSETTDEIETVRRVYQFVRDQIAHSGDINARTVTCNASEVLFHKHGICCAKAHLLAAVLRRLNIPVGFCYQWLMSDNDDRTLIIHGLNAVYLKPIQKWIRLDARGNKAGVNAQFSIDTETLAWPVRAELGETDDPVIYASPQTEVVQVLRSCKDRSELSERWLSALRSQDSTFPAEK